MNAIASSFAFPTSVFRALLACGIVLPAAGCTTTRTVYAERPLSERIPVGLLECEARPPLGDVRMLSGVARWIVEADAAGEDCRGKLGAVRRIVTEGSP